MPYAIDNLRLGADVESTPLKTYSQRYLKIPATFPGSTPALNQQFASLLRKNIFYDDTTLA
jgi:hypothetical protein